MKHQTLNILLKWLTKAGHSVDRKDFETVFLSHPDSDTLISITDTLTDFKIENTAAEIPKESLKQLIDPFIAEVKNKNHNTFILANLVDNEKVMVDTGSNKPVSVSVKEFLDRWTGVVIVVDKAKGINIKLNFTQLLPFLLLVFSVGLFLCLNIANLNIFSFFHFTLSIIGISISIFILAQELGFKSPLLNKVCNINTATSCNTVLSSKFSKIYKNVGLSDICVLYFIVQALFGLISNSLSPASNHLLFAISLLGLPITLYSIYLQKFIVQKWCPLCLGITGVLWLQFFIALTYFFNYNRGFNLDINLSIAYLCTLLIVVIVWMLFKPLLVNASKYKNVNIDALSFRRNHHLFIPFYANQKTFDTEISGLKDFSVGNTKAQIKVTAILSPDCPICSYTNQVLNSLQKKYPSDIYISYRLLANTNQLENIKTKAAVYLLSCFATNEDPADTLTNWYSKSIEEQLPKNFIIYDENDTELSTLKLYNQWCLNNGINYTPAIFINGKLFPDYYDKADIKYFIEEIINYELQNNATDAINASTKTVLVDNT